MKIRRQYTSPGSDVFATVQWANRTSRITNADGSVVFEMKDAECPAHWSQLAVDIMVSKYFRKAGVPYENAETPKRRNAEMGASDPSPQPAPEWRGGQTGPEQSARQVIHRLAGCWRHWGERHGYFDTPEDGQAFYDELVYMMLHQMAAPNSPQWFNTGLNWAYGISGPAQGHWIPDPRSGEVTPAPDAYSHPQPHACFIQSVKDDLVGPGGIMDLWTREARLFKYGSGTGTNFSALRAEGEKLSGGGTSSGLMSWLRIGDRAAGAIKSGGTTRRAAKMVCLDADHPDIEAFINWKVREELKVAAMVEGLKHLPKEQRELAAKLGLELTYDFNGEAYYTVSGQNSNNSVRVPDAFFDALRSGGEWSLIRRTDGSVAKAIPAADLWEQICFAAWRCADPGLQFDSTINAWHTCPNSGRINASNPCSEYMFLDNTACNLASINLLRFFDAESRTFDLAGYEHAIELWTIVLEISVLMASYPSREVAELSWTFRTLGLGYANLGAMLMQAGIPYDSEEGRAVCGALTSILTGRAYAASAAMAAELGPFPGFEANREPMLRVMRNHRRAARGGVPLEDAYEGLRIRPVALDHAALAGRPRIGNSAAMLDRAVACWDEALSLGERHGYRNAQTTVIAPTGTIGLLMDCDTTGVEPDFALTKFKKLAGGGYFKIANQSLRPALRSLGYAAQQIDDILRSVMGTLSLDTPMPEDARSDGRTLREFLRGRGYTSDELVQVENQLPTVFELSFAFSAWSMPERVLRGLGVKVETARQESAFNGLRAMGLSPRQIEQLNAAVCGTGTVEGAPHLRAEHLPVFDCANKCGRIGRRFIATEGHIRMMAAAQPFVSGAISKTINLPEDATVADIASAYQLSWELGLKANALYRDGSKLSQPLSTKSDGDSTRDEVAESLGKASTEAAAPAAGRAISISSTSFAPPGSTPAPGMGFGGGMGLSQAAEAEMLSRIDGSDRAAASAPVEPVYVERLVERVVEKVVERPLRRRLPDTRSSLTHRFNVAGHEGYLTVGLYEDGRPGELFITMSKEGSTIGGLMDSLGTAISVALQYGVPIESLVNKFAHQRFEPQGMTTNREIPFAKSLVDYIFRWMGMEFIPGYREANQPRRAGSTVEDMPRGEAPALAVAEPEGGNGHEALAARPRIGPVAAGGGCEPGGGAGVAAPAAGTGASGGSGVSGGGGAAVRAGERIAVAAMAERHTLVESAAGIVERHASAATVAIGSALDLSNAALMGDAPACGTCGSITVRNGACYKCLNCGSSLGCG
jgi:ribonucleoside-diphosphate reductase alpha chain